MTFSASGLDHLLYSGRGVGGHSDEATELHVACFMGLISFLASKQEVLRIAPSRPVRLLDATARAIIQTATPSQTPLTDAGLDGTGEIIQVCLTRAEYVCAIFWRLIPSERVIFSPPVVRVVCVHHSAPYSTPSLHDAALISSSRFWWHQRFFPAP